MPAQHEGRWPLAAAALTVPAWAIVAARRGRLRADDTWIAALAFPILVAHQTEEWVWPGGFLAFCNQRLLGSDEPAWPLTPRLGFHVNVTAGWLTALAAVATWRRTPAVAAGVLCLEAGNVLMHTSMAVRERAYNPGVATAAGLMLPHAALGARRLARSRPLTRRQAALAASAGLAFAALPAAMRLRLRRGAGA